MTKLSSMPIAFRDHNHEQCKNGHMKKIEEICNKNQWNLTAARKRVLEILLEDHHAIGAYTILERLQNNGMKPQPPIVYRALEFLVEHGFAHRIERLNAFIACAFPDKSHHPSFLLCRACENVAETLSANHEDLMNIEANSVHFHVERITLEAEGICSDCQRDSAK